MKPLYNIYVHWCSGHVDRKTQVSDTIIKYFQNMPAVEKVTIEK